VTIERDALNKTATITNNKSETGQITVTKNVTYNNVADDVTETFYVALYDSNGDDKQLVSEVKAISLTDASTGTATFTGLTVGTTYYVYETTQDGTVVGSGYAYAVDGQGTAVTIERDALNKTATITNNKITVEISVIKDWDDSSNQDGKRTESVTVKLLANGEDTGKTVTLSAENNWTASFEDLAKYNNGTEITYTVEEIEVPEGYTAAVNGNATDGYTITNTHAGDNNHQCREGVG
ncbi:MAG: Cna B-type domain-containing protein, partial [Lachnospiraceae bacterium]|nr:Cna B-type domain-containing protein [Lachnospiraceae bacterium]